MPLIIPYTFLSAFIVSIFLLQWWQEPTYPMWIYTILGFVGFLGIFFPRPRMAALTPATLGLTLALIGVSRIVTTPAERPIEPLATNQTITIEGVVADSPEDRQTRMQYVIDVTDPQDRILINDRTMDTRPDPGDVIRAKGKLSVPDDTDDFPYKSYLAMKGIHAVMEAREITIIETSSHHPLERLLWKLRLRFEDHIGRIFTEPGAGLLAGLLTGSQRGLPQNIQDDFRTTGLSHIVAVSGSNIAIVLTVLSGILFFIPIRWRLIPCIIGVVLFTLFVGAEASVVRACIMGILSLIALQTERQSELRLSVLWTAFFMLLWNPAQLWLDAGFQLSFLAVIGIGECKVLIDPITKRVPDIIGIREALTVSLTAQIMAVPWSTAHFGGLPLLSPIANLLVAPLIPFAMLTGFISTVAGALNETLGRIVGIPASLALETIIWIAQTCAAIPFASLDITMPTPWLLVPYYLVLSIVLFSKKIESADFFGTRRLTH
jgi:competence protein ComEC